MSGEGTGILPAPPDPLLGYFHPETEQGAAHRSTIIVGRIVDGGAPRHLHVSFQTQSSSFFSEHHPVPGTGRSTGQEGRPAICASVASKQNGFALAGFPGSSFF